MEKEAILVESLLSQMTIEEKVGLVHANSLFTTAGVERLGIDELTMSDGPHGVREEMSRTSWTSLYLDTDYCTYLPTGSAMAATWNPELARRFGEVLGEEARARRKDIILGPSVNIIRVPQCGRNFEYMSEDPYLIGQIAKEIVKGIQSRGTSACVKHFILNNQELNRMGYDVELSDRALNEIYLKGFHAAIMEGGAYSVMGAYNKFRGQHCCHNEELDKILRCEWGFDGVFMTDWGGAHDAEECLQNGLDLEMGTPMPYDSYYMAQGLIERAKKDPEAEKLLDEKVRRILRLMYRIGKFTPEERPNGAFATKEHQNTAYDIASEAMVLLKNEDKMLPLTDIKGKKILVFGENATAKHAHGGNSSGVKATYEITPLEGIKNRFKDCEIIFGKPIYRYYTEIPVEYLDITDDKAGCRGFTCESYTSEDFSGKPFKLSHVTKMYEGHSGEGSMLYSGTFTAPESSKFFFRAIANNHSRLYIGNELIKEFDGDGMPFEFELDMIKGDRYDITFRIVNIGGIEPELLWAGSSEIAPKETLFEQAREADYIIICAGQSHAQDTEGYDRESLLLPADQLEIVPDLINLNKNVIIALTSGSPVEIPWLDDVKAVVWTWYAGMEGGNVLADILLGRINPSGKLPFTLPKKCEDTPVSRYGEYHGGVVHYNDDIFVGYRGYDKDGIEPMYPFGHGLSYSEVSYSELNILSEDKLVRIRLNIENLSDMYVKETVQAYVGYENSSYHRPLRELKAFKKMHLNPHEKMTLELVIEKDDFNVFDEASKKWILENDSFKVEIGSSSRDIRLVGTVKI